MLGNFFSVWCGVEKCVDDLCALIKQEKKKSKMKIQWTQVYSAKLMWKLGHVKVTQLNFPLLSSKRKCFFVFFCLALV